MDINAHIESIKAAQAKTASARGKYQEAFTAYSVSRENLSQVEQEENAAVLAMFGMAPDQTVQVVCPHGWNGETRVFKGRLGYGRINFTKDKEGNITGVRATIQQGIGRRQTTKSGELVMNEAQKSAFQAYARAFGGAK